MIDRDLLERVGDGAGQILGVAGFALQNHAEREDRVRLFLQRDLAHHDRDLKRARHLMNGNVRRRRKRAQFGEGMIDQALDVGPVEQARDDREMLFAPRRCAGARRSEL